MANLIPPPDVRNLLPPLLVCLPTGFASPRPPPALLPLLSPVLRQRVQLLSATAESPADSWLPLLCWESVPAEKLSSIVESEAFELHPVSGEIEFGEVGTILYTRVDEETLKAKVGVADLGLRIVYLWCPGDHEGGGDGWRVGEVSPLDHTCESPAADWWPSLALAEEKAKETSNVREPGSSTYPAFTMTRNAMTNGTAGADEEDDDDYWAQYDRTPGRTPGPGRSPSRGERGATREGQSASEAAYYEQYAQVQPEMDNDDPSEDRAAIGASSLNGSVVASSMSQPYHAQDVSDDPLINGTARDPLEHGSELDLSHPKASSPTLTSEVVSHLEDSASLYSTAEVAIRQHVSTSIKSLFRLCRNVGMERPDFDELVRTELETLSMLTEDD